MTAPSRRTTPLLRRWRALSALRRDVVAAVVLTAIGQLELVLAADQVEGPRWLQHLAFAVMTGAIALRRRVPVAAPVLGGLGLTAQELAGTAPAASGFVALVIVTYSVATYAASRRSAAGGLLAVLLALAVYPLTVEDAKLADEIVNGMIPVTIWALARVARERQERAVALERQTVRAESEARREREAALVGERRRIARELHDTVAHGVTLMLLQTEVMRGNGDDVDAAVDVLQEAGRSCLEDLRTLLQVLRDAAPDDTTPRTRLLPAVLSAARSAGTTVRGALPEPLPVLPPSVDETVFRVVQEAVTNAVRHARGGTVDVTWGVADGLVEVDVRDDGARSPGVVHAGGGHGLIGLRERVSLLGGTLDAGPYGERGWRVHACVPVPA